LRPVRDSCTGYDKKSRRIDRPRNRKVINVSSATRIVFAELHRHDKDLWAGLRDAIQVRAKEFRSPSPHVFDEPHVYEIPITLISNPPRKPYPTSGTSSTPRRDRAPLAGLINLKVLSRARALLCSAKHAPQGASDVGHHHAGRWARLLRAVGRLHDHLRSALRRTAMIFDYSLAALVTAGLLFYLTYALLRPERF
jgi:K+-transporting ATPase KdpF subunit